MSKILLINLLLSIVLKVQAQFIDTNFPKDIPQIFAGGTVSNGLANRDMAISPDWNEIYYTLQHNNGQLSTILFSKKVNGKWTLPEIVSFSGKYNDLEPAFSSDGTRLYFSSNRPLKEGGETKDYDIWFVTNTKTGWSEPQNMGEPINSSKDEFYPSVAKSGNMYFTREVEGAKEDIVVCNYVNGKYQEAVRLSDAVNSKGYEFNAFVDPDEKFVLFSAYQRPDDVGRGDLYASKRTEKGEWQPATHLNINSKSIDYCPYVSPDGKYLFFASSRSELRAPFAERQTYSKILSKINEAGNGLDDIYWVSLKGIMD